MSVTVTDRSSTPPLAEVVAATGATYRMLDHWVRRNYLHPDHAGGTGHPRTWPAEEIRVARRMVELVAAGLTVEAAHHAARNHGLLPGGCRVIEESPWP